MAEIHNIKLKQTTSRRRRDVWLLALLAFCSVILPVVYVHSALLPDGISDANNNVHHDVLHEPTHNNSTPPPPPPPSTLEPKHEVCLSDHHSSPGGIHQKNVCLFLSPRFVPSAQARSECSVSDHQNNKKPHHQHRHRTTQSHIVELQLKPPLLGLLEQLRSKRDEHTHGSIISGAAWVMNKGNVSAILITNATFFHSDSELNGYTTLLADTNLPVLCVERGRHKKSHHHHSRWNWMRMGKHNSNNNSAKSADADSATASLGPSKDAQKFHSNASHVNLPAPPSFASSAKSAPATARPASTSANSPRVKRAVHYKVTRQNVAAKKAAAVAAAQPEFDDDDDGGGEEEDEADEDIPDAAAAPAPAAKPARVDFDDWDGIDTKELKPQADFDASEASVIVKYRDNFDADNEEGGEEEVVEEQHEDAAAIPEKKKVVVASKKVVPQQPYKIKYFKSFDEDDEENMDAAAAPAAAVVVVAAPKVAHVEKEKPAAKSSPPETSHKKNAAPAVVKKQAEKPAAKPAKPAAAKPQYSVGDDESKQDHDDAPNDPDEWRPPAKKSAASFAGAAAQQPAAKPAVAKPAPVAVVAAMANKPHLDDVVAPPAQAAAPAAKPAGVVVPPQPAAAAVQLAAANEMTAYDRKADKNARKQAKQAKKAQKKAQKAAKKPATKKGRHHRRVSVDADAPEVVAKAPALLHPAAFDEKDDAATVAAVGAPAAAEKAAGDAAAQSSDAAEKAADAAGAAEKAAASSDKAADAAAAAGAEAEKAADEEKQTETKKMKKKKKKKRIGNPFSNPFKGKKHKGADGKTYRVYQVPIAKIANMQENSMDRLFGTAKVTLRNALEQLPEPLQDAETHDDFTARAILTHIVARYYRNYNERDIHEIAKRLFRSVLSKGKPRQCFKAEEANTFEPVACLSPDGPVETCLKQDFQNGTLRRGCGLPNKGMSVMKGSCDKDKHGFVKCACDRDLCNSAQSVQRLHKAEYFVAIQVVVALVVAAIAAGGATCSATEWMQYFVQ